MFFRNYSDKSKWEIRRCRAVKHVDDDDDCITGYTAYICLRNIKSGRSKVVKIGNCCWTYPTLEALKTAIFKKTGIEIE